MSQTHFDFETSKSRISAQSFEPGDSRPPAQQTIRSLLALQATGLGKTAIMAGVAARYPRGRIMLISHRFELNQQAMSEFEKLCCEQVDLEQAMYRADQNGERHRIVVASVQTLNSMRNGKYRMEKFNPEDFGLLLIDEAHRAVAVTYQRVIDHFRQNPHCRVLGVTATGDRLDGIGMGEVFEEIVCDRDMAWGVRNGWLCDPKQHIVYVKSLDFSAIRTVGGDLDQVQLQQLVEIEQNLHAMADPIVDFCGDTKQCITFTASVAQAHRLAEMIKDYHLRAFGHEGAVAVIDGKTSPQHPARRQVVRDFKSGEIQHLVNCGVATEGFNAPACSVIAIAKPTKSRMRYTQMVGRGGRTLPGVVDGLETSGERLQAIAASDKPHFDVIDFVGQCGRHKLICTADIMAGKNEAPAVVERAKEMTKESGWDSTMAETIEEARRRIAEEQAKRLRVTTNVDYEMREQGSSLYDLTTIPQRPVPGYLRRTQPTAKQRSMLMRLGYTLAQISRLNTRTASGAIDYAIWHPRTGFGKWLRGKKIEEGAKPPHLN